MRKALALIVLLIAGQEALAQHFAWYGYVKELAIGSRSVLDGESYVLSVSRFRLQGSADRGLWKAEIWTDTELRAGSFLETVEAQLAEAVGTEPLVSLATRRDLGDRAQARASIYRMTLTRAGDRATLSIGRQRISWGTGFVWTPTDLLNPVPPTSLERDEMPAVDAARLRVALDAVSGVDLVVAPGARREDGRYGVRFQGHRGEYDLGLMGGWFAKSWVMGGDFAGYLGDAGLRGEWTLSREASGLEWNPDAPVRLRAVVNADYTLSNGLYLALEGYLNGFGATSRHDYRVRDNGGQGLARHYLALIAGRSLHPLVAANLYALHNADDGSGLFGPSISWSVWQNVEAGFSVYAFYGAHDSEFGAFHPVWFGTLQLFF